MRTQGTVVDQESLCSLPPIGVSNLVTETRELRKRLPLSVLAHPREGADRLPHRQDEAVDELLTSRLGSRAEGSFDIKPGDGFSDFTGRSGKHPLPALLLLLFSPEGLAVEGEGLVLEARRKAGSSSSDQMPAGVGA